MHNIMNILKKGRTSKRLNYNILTKEALRMDFFITDWQLSNERISKLIDENELLKDEHNLTNDELNLLREEAKA